ncbi:MAG: glycosyltransferase family 4 protein [Chloroflexi bacterium]|nr:glycosyltransferase family 4 protein [Chloroflexota bacterium]
MRICLASIHPRILSGQIESLVALGRELRALGHDVRLVSAFSEDVLYRDARWDLKTGDGQPLAPKLVRIWRIVRDVCREARSADVVHLNLPTPAFSPVADLVYAATHRPTIVGYEAHLSSLRTLLGGGHLWRAPAFYLPRALVNNGLVARAALNRCHRYVVSSGWQRTELVRLGVARERVAVIPNLIDTSKLQRWPRDEARRRLGLPLAHKLIVYVGHYHPVKGVELLPAALRQLRRAVPEARLVLAWSGIGKRETVVEAIERAGVREQVIEIGRVDVGQVMSAADVVAAPYTLTIGQAAFPAVPLEAIHLGRPLVTSDLPLLRELTHDGQAALLVRDGDAAALAAGILALLAEPARTAAMSEAQRRLRETAYRPERIAQRYVALYKAALRRQAGVLQPAFGQR